MDPEPRADPLVQAALLEQFAEAELLELLPGAGAAIAALLGGGGAVTPAGPDGQMKLTEGARAAAFSRLRRAGPEAEIALRTRVLHAFLERMGRLDGAAGARAEALVFAQLARLFVLHYLRFEWRAIIELVEQLEGVRLREVRHQRRAQLYRAFVAVRTGDYTGGKAVLDGLLAADDLEPQVRLEATQALGHMHRFLTSYDLALETYAELGRLAEEAGMPVYQGVAQFNLGAVYNELEDYERALAYVIESERIFARHDDQERLAYAYYCAGLNAMYLGRWQYARGQYERALVLFEQFAMEPTLALCHWGQGLLALLLGDRAASERAYRQAILRSTSSGRGDLYLALDSWADLGFLYFTQDRHADALECYGEALALAGQLGHEHRASFIHFLRARALQALGRAAEAEVAYAAAMDSVDALRGAHTSEDVKISVLGTAQQVYEAAALFYLGQGRAAEAFAVVERARSRAFLDGLAARAPELFETFDQPTAPLAEVQAALPPDALLLAYYTTGVLPAGEHFYHSIPPENRALLEHLLLPAGVVLFAVTRDGLAAHSLALDPNAVRATAGDPRPGRHLVRDRVLASLYERLLAPAEGLLEGRASLFIVPHGPLHAVPFMALRSRDGRHLVRDGGPAVALAPSATVLVRNCLGRPQAPATAEALAVGFNGSGEAGLRFAETEAHMAARALGGRALTGGEARAGAILSAAGRLRALHIAGHARFQPDDPLGSYVGLAAGDRLSARVIMGASGLRADLVVLSACTSGLSHVVPGDELLGLQRAWLFAGAAAVVCALWEAPDLVTLLVMERFYAALAAGAGQGEALRDALVAVRSLTGRELEATFARWRAEEPALAVAGALPVIPPELADRPLYADPVLWAPFMLIGRP